MRARKVLTITFPTVIAIVYHSRSLAVLNSSNMTPNAVARVGSSVCRVKSGKLAAFGRRSLSTGSQRNPDGMERQSGRKLLTAEEHCARVPNQVIFQEHGECGLITLNRPNVMNVISAPMSRDIIAKIKEWQEKKGFLMVEANGNQAFCAGGDLHLVSHTVREDINPLACIFFANLYRLCYTVNQCKIPCIVLMNNMTLGGGMAVSVPAKYRVITEKSVHGMPEVLVGHFPDAGCSYFYSRLPNYIGYYMAMTATTLSGIDLLRLGIGTHYVPSERLADLKNDLLASKAQDVEVILHKYQPKDLLTQEFSLAPHLKKITECFSAPTVDEIVSRLENDKSEWAKKTLEKLDRACPLSVKLTHRMLQMGENMNLAQSLSLDYRVAIETVKPDTNMEEGVITKIVEKRNDPQWNPKCLKDVTEEHVTKIINQYKVVQLDLSV